jgi:hypothetical protein
MKKLLLLALCALFAAGAAEAKTYYVDASRPNNNGNGLKPATAKKTIQAAVNLAQKGDTILVQPGEYAPFKTNNKKITIKSVKGASKTKIVKTAAQKDMALAQLGKAYVLTYQGSDGPETYSSIPYTKGKDTVLAGFLLDGKNRSNGYCDLIGVSGGTVKSCSIQRLGKNDDGIWLEPVAAADATLTACTILGNHATLAETCVFSRCRLADNQSKAGSYYPAVSESRLCNCLVAGNRYRGTSGRAALFEDSTLVNCTIAKNRTTSGQAPFTRKSKYYNCILRNNWRGSGNTVHNTDSGNTYGRTFQDNRNPKFVKESSGDYKLAKGSPCINQGTVPAAIKSYVGSTDLAGKKRINGASIDMGCYEY